MSRCCGRQCSARTTASYRPAGWIRRIGRVAPWAGIDDPGPLGFGQVRPHGEGPAAVLLDLVRPEHLERVLVVAMNHWADRVQGKLGLHDDYLL